MVTLDSHDGGFYLVGFPHSKQIIVSNLLFTAFSLIGDLFVSPRFAC